MKKLNIVLYDYFILIAKRMDFKRIFNKENFKNVLFILIGSILSAISINMFLFNAKLISGGLTGIALIVQHLFDIQAGYFIIAINIPLFIISRKKINRRFTVYSFIGVLTFSLSLIYTRSISSILNIDDKLMLCLYGGVLDGLGYGLVFAHLGSIGGFDIISMLIKKKYTHIDISKISMCIDVVVVFLGSFVFGLTSALYTIVAIFISSYVMNCVLKGFSSAKSVIIVTDHESEVANQIISELDYGVTKIKGEGVYSQENKQILYCVIPSNQLPILKNIVNESDPQALITVSEVSEIKGRGFKRKI